MRGLWKAWLVTWCWVTFAVGAVFAAGGVPALDGGVRLFYDAVAWPIDGVSPYGEDVRLTAALLGCVMMGWMVAVLGLIDAAEAVGVRAWRTITLSVVGWYAIDSALSVYLGAPMNALSNTGFLVTFLIPIIASGVLRGDGGALATQPRS